MNCCGNHNHNDNDNHNQHEKAKRHGTHGHPMWMMALCCGAPLIILAIITLLGSFAPGTKAFLISILPFICPVMMIAMLPMMFFGNRKSKHSCEAATDTQQIEEKTDDKE